MINKKSLEPVELKKPQPVEMSDQQLEHIEGAAVAMEFIGATTMKLADGTYLLHLTADEFADLTRLMMEPRK